MGRITMNDLDRIESGLDQEWFSLKNHGDTARVQFVMDKYEDIQVYMTHKVKPNGNQFDIRVDCLRENYDDPLSKCPLCEAGIATGASKFIGIYNKASKKVQIWERGTRFLKNLQPYFERYQPLRNYVFDIQRQGASGDKQTQYNIFPVPNEQGENISNLTYNALGMGVRQWSVEDMKNYLSTGNAPMRKENAQNDTTPQFSRGIPAQVDNQPIGKVPFTSAPEEEVF